MGLVYSYIVQLGEFPYMCLVYTVQVYSSARSVPPHVPRVPPHVPGVQVYSSARRVPPHVPRVQVQLLHMCLVYMYSSITCASCMYRYSFSTCASCTGTAPPHVHRGQVQLLHMCLVYMYSSLTCALCTLYNVHVQLHTFTLFTVYLYDKMHMY